MFMSRFIRTDYHAGQIFIPHRNAAPDRSGSSTPLAGRRFHSLGPSTRESPIANVKIGAYRRITAKSPRVDDRSPLDLEAEHGATMDDMYDGEVPEWI